VLDFAWKYHRAGDDRWQWSPVVVKCICPLHSDTQPTHSHNACETRKGRRGVICFAWIHTLKVHLVPLWRISRCSARYIHTHADSGGIFSILTRTYICTYRYAHTHESHTRELTNCTQKLDAYIHTHTLCKKLSELGKSCIPPSVNQHLFAQL